MRADPEKKLLTEASGPRKDLLARKTARMSEHEPETRPGDPSQASRAGLGTRDSGLGTSALGLGTLISGLARHPGVPALLGLYVLGLALIVVLRLDLALALTAAALGAVLLVASLLQPAV